MQNKVKTLLPFLACVLIMIPLYIILHEGGHSFIAILCGAKITKFRILGASITSVGGDYNQFTSSLMNAFGMLLPVLSAFLYMLLYNSKKESILYRVFSFFFCLAPISSLLAWVVIPVIYIWGDAPASDDVTKFLNTSAIYPLWVTLGALLLLSFLLLFAWHKKIFQNYIQAMKSLGVRNDSTQA